ncbi:MAG: serine/threonine protein kinase, partial [Myxococcales bacterium]|nr:serine/threonine protein kinase [Myxococcales bacterium]
MSARDHALDQTVAAQHTADELDDETSGTLLQLTPNSSKRRARSLERGAVVGRYVVLSELGSGAMGIVYAAYDPELDRKVALKLVRTTSGRRGGDEEQRTRLLREAQALAKLNHPNVVSVHDVGTLEGRVWIAMEYVHGQTLDAWGATPRPWREVLEVMRRAGEGLAAAHDAGLLHRDFKPQNVMLGHDGRVRVMDFGLARSRRGDEDDAVEDAPTRGGDDPLASRESALARDVTRAGAMMGTPAYM